MSEAKIIMKEVPADTFPTVLFKGGADILVPLAFELQQGEQIQSLQNALGGEIIKRHITEWGSLAGVAGVAQYSLRHGAVGVLGKVLTYFRPAFSEEIRPDIMEFGEQVIRGFEDIPREEWKKYPVIEEWGIKQLYVGPSRLEKTVVLSRGFQADGFPQDVSRLVAEIDGASETGDMIVSQGYQMFFAKDGRLDYLPFRELKHYNLVKVRRHGQVQIDDKHMWWLPEGYPDRINFTEALIE
nr:hypothetical protein [Nanoarchaeum sp.]